MLLCEILLHLLPGDATTMVLQGAGEHVSAEGAARLRAAWGQDLSLGATLSQRLSALVRGDLGTSFVHGRPVGPVLVEALSLTAPLMLLSLLIGLPGGFALGLWTSSRRSPARSLAVALGALWLASPVFALAVAHQHLGESLGLPTTGSRSVGWLGDASPWGMARDHLHHMLLPLWVLCSLHAALAARYTHRLAHQARQAPSIRMAHARGLPPALVRRHYLTPLVLTRLAPLLSARMATIVASNLVVEMVFVWPGLGTALWEAIQRRDASMVTGGLLLVGVTVYIANRLADAASFTLDPVRRRREAA